MNVVVRETLAKLNERGADLCMFKNCDAKTKDKGALSYQQAVIQGMLCDDNIKIRHKGALAKLGNFYLDKFDICRSDAADKIKMVDGDHLEKIENLEEKVDNEKRSTTSGPEKMSK